MKNIARVFAPMFGIPCDIQNNGMLYVLDVPIVGKKQLHMG